MTQEFPEAELDLGHQRVLPEWIDYNGHMNVAYYCLLYTSPSPRDLSTSRMPSSA